MPEDMEKFNMCRKRRPITQESAMATVQCNYCHKRGHMKLNCYKRLKLCFACHMPGHYVAQCKQQWRLRIQRNFMNIAHQPRRWNGNEYCHKQGQCLHGRQEHNHRQYPRVAVAARSLPFFGSAMRRKYEATNEQKNFLSWFCKTHTRRCQHAENKAAMPLIIAAETPKL